MEEGEEEGEEDEEESEARAPSFTGEPEAVEPLQAIYAELAGELKALAGNEGGHAQDDAQDDTEEDSDVEAGSRHSASW